MTDPAPTRLRLNVGAILMRPADGYILMARRITPPNAWQMPQGGVDRGEALEAAMWREVAEELGLDDPQACCTLLGHGPATAYYFPKGYTAPIARKYAGQEQTLYLLAFDGDESLFDLGAHHTPEFDAIRWMHPRDALDLLWEVKRPILDATLRALEHHFPIPIFTAP